MLKINRLLAIITLFLFVLIMGSCGGGGGDYPDPHEDWTHHKGV